MLLSLKWLQEFTPYAGTAEKLGDRLTMFGLELEDIIHPFADIEQIIIGHVLSCEAHPNSDHMSICTVDVGPGADGTLDIVCGAPNIRAGQRVAVAPVGAALPGGIIIKKAKLRGVPSNGMICSERELGLGEDQAGIMVLDASAPVGTKLLDYLNLDKEILNISVTPNRADALSVLGLARETALAFNLPLTLPKITLAEEGEDWTNKHPVQIADAKLCPLYQLRLIENVKIAPSPANIRYRLLAVGVRPISNVVDVTNYILMELGQPLHSFDRNKITGQITVSPAKEDESLITLDGQKRKLTSGDLLIRDQKKPVALAGVMGGLNSEITNESTSVLLESAIFDPISIRRTSRRLGLVSEASYRYERGVDQQANTYAMNRAASMIAALSGGRVRRGVSRMESSPWIAPQSIFRPQRACLLLGLPQDALSPAFCKDTLGKLGCSVNDSTPDAWQVKSPSWRPDLSREADLIEEVGRVYGLDRLPETLPVTMRPLERAGDMQSRHSFLQNLRAALAFLGLNEAINYSFVGQADLDRLRLPVNERIAIMNPLSEELNVLRTALAPGLLHTLRENITHDVSGVRIFEIAASFHAAGGANSTTETGAKEVMRLGLVLYGARHDSVWGWGNDEADYPELRGLIEHVLSLLHLSALRCSTLATHPYLSPCICFEVEGYDIGCGGRLSPQIADFYHAKKPVWLAELDLDALFALQQKKKPQFKPLAIYPAAKRDLTIILPEGMSVAAVIDAIQDMHIKILEDISLIDLYEPKDSKKRHATYRMTFRHAHRTLKDTEANKERDKIAATLINKLGVEV